MAGMLCVAEQGTGVEAMVLGGWAAEVLAAVRATPHRCLSATTLSRHHRRRWLCGFISGRTFRCADMDMTGSRRRCHRMTRACLRTHCTSSSILQSFGFARPPHNRALEATVPPLWLRWMGSVIRWSWFHSFGFCRGTVPQLWSLYGVGDADMRTLLIWLEVEEMLGNMEKSREMVVWRVIFREEAYACPTNYAEDGILS